MRKAEIERELFYAREAIKDVLNHVREKNTAKEPLSFRYIESRLLDAKPKKSAKATPQGGGKEGG